MATYTYSEAVEQTITAGEQIHQIVNGTATTEVTVEDGSKVPSIRKALIDNFYFKDPIAWQVGQTENVFNQLRQFTDGSWWYAPSATASNPTSMGATPVGDSLWKIYDFDAIGKLEPRIDEALRRSYAEAGYHVVGTFQAGFTLVNANDIGIDEVTGKGFTGPAGTVDAGTNPSGVGFTDRSGELLRTKVGSIVVNSTHVADVPGIDLSGSVNNRAAIFTVSGTIFIPAGVTVKCNLWPDDDVRKFVGQGKVLSTDQWGFTHTLDVAAMYTQQDRSDQGRIFQAFHTHEWCRVGVLGDSITDGADATGWTANPTDVNGNLNSSSHDHSLNGGAVSWFRTFADNLNFLANPAYVYSIAYIKPYNAASSGKRLADGWGYRNFDYGFFQNAAYGNKAPDVLYVALGYNDASYTDTPSEMESYRDQLDKLICKARGYGCSVALVTINTNDVPRKSQERSVKESAAKKYGINYYDLSSYLDKYRRSGFEPASSMWQDPDLSWDTTHPKTQTQQFLGAAMTHAVAYNMLICAGDDINHIPLTGADFRNITYPGGVQKPVSQYKLSGEYLNQLDGWALIQPNENITITYPVWCEDPQLSAIIFEPFHPDFTTASRSHSLGTRLNDRRSTKQINTLASAKFPNHTKWLTTRIGNLKYGLNWIEVIYDGAPSRLYPPAILFRKSNDAMAVGKVTRFAAPNVELPICLFGAREKLLNTKYQAAGGLDLMVDENNTDNYDSLGWFTIGGGDGVAMLVSYKTGEGIQITKVNNTTVTIGLAGQAVDVTLTGVFSNGFSVAINHEPNGSSTSMRVSIYDDNNAVVSNRLMSPPNGVGGALSVINTSSTTKPISVSGGYGYLT
jgi:lysophospholipase L1-like esterase